MNSNIKLSLALLTGLYFFSGCDNGKTSTEKQQSDTTVMSDIKSDNMNKMDPGTMTMTNNGLMSSMQTMMDKMSSMKMSGDFALDFANMMIEHHQGAIDMSNIELSKGTDEKLKVMAQQIITEQTNEIEVLRDIIKNYKSSGMKHGEGTLEKINAAMNTNMSDIKMSDNTDKDYAMMMIAHHEGAVKMFTAQINNGMNEKLKQLSKKGITDQTKEIAAFKAWDGKMK
ncbi:MAG: DUF305 domain-containing protein [Bacteroidetes bacterium]|nr:DUF305 domain-containing protein [Bacteroidota bacterium]